MDESRRGFLKTAGVSLLGIGWAAPVAGAVAQALKTEKLPEGLAGRRWAMVVDVAKCQAKNGCTACARACHTAHNVPRIHEKKHEVKWIWKEPFEKAFPDEVHEYTAPAIKESRVPVLCNHCERPPCVRVCPTQATFKRHDGLVMMDQHRCIGCRYCIVACPYGARSFNWKDPRPFIPSINDECPTRMKGVVEKCTFCAERLARGLGPACVEACEDAGGGAIMFGDLGDSSSQVAEVLRTQHTIRRRTALGTAPHVFYIV